MAAYLAERGSPVGLEHNPRVSGDTPHRQRPEFNCDSHDCPNCAELREEIAYLRSELGLSDKTALEHSYRTAFGLTAQEARTLIALAQAKGRVLTHAQLEDAMERAEQGEWHAIAGVYVCRIRKAIGYDCIETVKGGYRITPFGLSKVNTIGAGATSPDAR